MVGGGEVNCSFDGSVVRYRIISEVQICGCTALAITLVNIQCLPSKLELASYLLPDIDTIIDEPNVMIDLTRHSR